MAMGLVANMMCANICIFLVASFGVLKVEVVAQIEG